VVKLRKATRRFQLILAKALSTIGRQEIESPSPDV